MKGTNHMKTKDQSDEKYRLVLFRTCCAFSSGGTNT